MGIKLADIQEVVVVWRRDYAHCCPVWHTRWQVSGQFDSGTEKYLLPRLAHLRRRGEDSVAPCFWRSLSKRNERGLKGAMVWAERISRAGRWPIGATRKSGRRRHWRLASNVWDSTSAAKWWPSSKLACVVWKIIGSSLSNEPSAFPSSGFSPKKFRRRMRNMGKVFPSNCPILVLQRSQRSLVANAES